MPSESASLSLLSIISLLGFFVVFLMDKFSYRIGNGILLDKDFDKPQAFHNESIARSGGLAGIITLIIFFTLYFFLFGKVLLDYIFLSFFMFLIGFPEDIRIKTNPNYRLLFMVLFLSIFVLLFSVNVGTVDLNFLNAWMKNSIFSFLFTLLCFLFIINGSNLVDGFNGLLSIHLLIINFVLLILNLDSNEFLSTLITVQIVILLSFLLFNFPKAKMFLGDSGAYLFGALVAYNIIQTNNSNPNISSFFFCILLFYLFFEVFFSFFRKLYSKKSPFKPDREHLHMLLFYYLDRSKKFKDCNYLTAIVINLVYLSFILPAIFLSDNGLISRYWFLSLILMYIIFYNVLYNFKKNN